MQSLAITDTAHNPNSHTAAEALSALRFESGSRYLSFRYERFDSAGVSQGDLDNVLDCTVTQDWLATIKRKARFKVRDDGSVNFLSDMIKPWVRLHLPPYGDDDWVEWPQGLFLLASPKRSIDESSVVIRDVEAYDRCQVFADDKVDSRYTATSGSLYTSTVATLLNGYPMNVVTSTAACTSALEWPPGTTKLKIINELLGAAGYNSLSFDENGNAVATPYVLPTNRGEEYTYADDTQSVMLPDVDQTIDLFDVPNKWVLYTSRPDQTSLTSTYTNNDPASLTSTVTRQRTIVAYEQINDVAGQSTLDTMAERRAFEASQMFETIEFTTAIMPIHSGNDVYKITASGLAVSSKYVETSWSTQLKDGATMKHSARRVVRI